MIKDGFYHCPKGHKLQQITETSTHIGTFYCRHCGVHYPVNIVNGMEDGVSYEKIKEYYKKDVEECLKILSYQVVKK